MSRNDSGKRVVELDVEILEFAVDNCEVNMNMALGMLQRVHDNKAELSRETGQKIVDMLEKFRSLKKALEDAR